MCDLFSLFLDFILTKKKKKETHLKKEPYALKEIGVDGVLPLEKNEKRNEINWFGDDRRSHGR